MSNTIVYDFDPDDYFYTGKIKAHLDPIAGNVMIPAHATDVPPPEYDTDNNEIPVFDIKKNKWSIITNNFWKPQIKITNFDVNLEYELFPLLPIVPIQKIQQYPSIPRLLNSHLYCMSSISRINTINTRIKNSLELYKRITDHNNITTIETYFYYRTEIEMIIHLIKKFIDEVISINYVKLFIDEIKENHTIEIDRIGKMFNNKNYKVESVKKEINFEKHSDFLKQINIIHNSVKHDFFLSEVNNLIGEHRGPVIAIIKTHGKTFDRIEIQLYDLGRIITKLTDFINDNFIM